ncbi:hypothetical protein BYT27DRAFT_7213740 [Phlegmacium glaucopus]|nr:hypothetical protein BYT27DRAFT_7213740 [Phlegmacium glaucopus]
MQLKEAADAIIASATAKSEVRAERSGTIERRSEEREDTYASRAKRVIPTSHANVVAKVELQKRKIRLAKADGMAGEDIYAMSEKELVEKANITIKLMVECDIEKPEGARGKEAMRQFIGKMGSTMDHKAQTYEVVIDWVPTLFNVEQKEAWTSIEFASGLHNMVIQDARWAKNNGYSKRHRAADRRCPVFLERVERMNKTHQENAYKYFCTMDPDTWETYTNKEEETGSRGADRYWRKEQERGHNKEHYREGRGHLAGGQQGEGGGQRSTNNRWAGTQNIIGAEESTEQETQGKDKAYGTDRGITGGV